MCRRSARAFSKSCATCSPHRRRTRKTRNRGVIVMPDEPLKNENGSQTDDANVTAIATAELEQLRKSAAEREEYLDLARRTQAEFENYQKRNQKDRELERRYAL